MFDANAFGPKDSRVGASRGTKTQPRRGQRPRATKGFLAIACPLMGITTPSEYFAKFGWPLMYDPESPCSHERVSQRASLSGRRPSQQHTFAKFEWLIVYNPEGKPMLARTNFPTRESFGPKGLHNNIACERPGQTLSRHRVRPRPRCRS
ncbi:uncharacterized protein BDZ99DRAFT_480760 [Mytilinidion resinicola]|uniref:Uncharacterized protein n=1 Tax=Mytilinidion resinicola TaxID=574789 RepID=A0A6A6Y986_9PEZI|nr:uncharacterized protein BDZ99DRAFT_480760 [Mytilinidion resinicola]KAF2805381.1 hypothetical protein BDZ99DRAFT_480760 [Mytilinidion resinicola]